MDLPNHGKLESRNERENDNMAKEKNGKVNVTSFKIDKALHEQIQLLANDDLRSFNAQIIYILTKTLREEKWQNKIKELQK